ncbi:MAG TPA: hypothetical protein DCG53_12425 [Syntrophus sp. (in: bacteria)]|nr:hypothetical protein [Syntrophus sp. (in: bacteria)]
MHNTKTLRVMVISIIIMLTIQGTAAASGPFGPPQPVSRPAGGLHTGFGYWLQEDKLKNSNEEYISRQQQIYSELGYGFQKNWDLFARVGLSGLKLFDAFSPATTATTTSKNDFSENWKFFTTLGAKGFYPVHPAFGIGAFVQGSYYFSDFTDNTTGTRNGAPFTIELGLKNLWDISAGIGFQATIPWGVNLYVGPYIYYTETKAAPSANITGLALTAGETTLKNNALFGGFAGIDAPLSRGFRLQIEGKYADRLSGGAAITYSY